MFEPVAETSTNTTVSYDAVVTGTEDIDFTALVDAYVEDMANNPTAEEEVSNQLVK